MNKIRKFFHKELEYLRDLTADQRNLLTSVFYYCLAVPMITTFSNTYLWRQSKDPIILALFNIGFFAGLPIGFLINGFLLRKHKPIYMYALGCVLQGIVPVILVLSGTQGSNFALGLGVALGVAGGFYWGNRNLLTSEITVGAMRYKYLSLESIVGLGCAIIAPLITGWFLVMGERTGWYSLESAYRISAAAGFLLLLLAAKQVFKIQHVSLKIQRIFIPAANRMWNQMRAFEFVNGLTNGIEAALLLVAVLVFLQNESSIGTLQAVTSILAALGMYLLGKRVKHRDHVTILGLWSAITLVGKVMFAWSFSFFGAIALHTISGFANSFRWASTNAVMFETVDAQSAAYKESVRFAYLMDREFALNFGRVAALLLFIAAYFRWPILTLRYGLFATLFSQAILILLTAKLTKHISHKEVITPVVVQKA